MDEGPQDDEPNRWDDPKYGRHVPIEERVRRTKVRVWKSVDEAAMPDLFPGNELDEFLIWLRQMRDEDLTFPERIPPP